MRTRNVRLAVSILRASRWRSLMTMTGIVLGVVSVITVVSLGEGLKRQVVAQMHRRGNDLIIVRPGKLLERDSAGSITNVTAMVHYAVNSGSLGDGDLEVAKRTGGVKQAVPISLVSSSFKAEDQEYTAGVVVGTNEHFPEVLKQKVTYGEFFSSDEAQKHEVVIGKRVAEELFHENVPVGSTLTIRGQSFIVVGIFDDFETSPLLFGPDFNRAAIIPYQAARQLSGGTQLVEILVRPTIPENTQATIANLTSTFRAAHNDQEDFTVLKQDEDLAVISNILNIFTAFIAGVAAMSLLVGGIGIMNIMLVSVSERTREIGIRKSLGATNRQIANQFFVEAAVVSTLGGAIGIVLAYVGNFILTVTTELQPVISWQVVVLAGGVSVLIGVIFGIIPALRAARKDPIEALRYE